MKPKTIFITFTLLFAVGTVFRLYHLGAHSLWLDEIGQVVIASANWQQLFTLVGHHLSPPLDYILLKGVLILGNSDWAVRLPAFLYGIASIPVIYLLARRISGSETALITTTLFAFLPMAIAFSQEARMYSLLLLLSLVSYYLTILACEKISWKVGLGLGLVNGSLLLTHYFGIIVIAMEMIILSAILIKKDVKNSSWLILLLSLVVSLSVFMPWIAIFLRQVKNSGGEIWYALEPKLHFFKMIFSRFTSDTEYRDIWFYLFGIFFLIGIVKAWRDKEYRILTVAISLIGILGALFVFSFYKRIVTPRNVIFLLPLFLMVCSRGIGVLLEKYKINIIIGMSFLAVIMIWPVYRYHFLGRPDYKPNWKGAAEYIHKHSSSEEKVMVTDVQTRGCLAYYLTPEAEYVFMRKRWNESTNEPDWKIWVADEKLIENQKNKKWKGWVVFPPHIPEDTKAAYFLPGIIPSPAKTFKTQGKPLEVYHLE